MSDIDWADVEAAAKECAGSWRSWEAFVWGRARELSDSHNWFIGYTSNRDSKVYEQVNAEVIAEALKPYTTGTDPDAVAESHNHWAVGYVDGFSIRVYGYGGGITPAFRVWCELQARLADYPYLDEERTTMREMDAAFEYWNQLSTRGRIRECADAGVSIFASRRSGEIPEKVEESFRNNL